MSDFQRCLGTTEGAARIGDGFWPNVVDITFVNPTSEQTGTVPVPAYVLEEMGIDTSKHDEPTAVAAMIDVDAPRMVFGSSVIRIEPVT